jgi:hypothetical protein
VSNPLIWEILVDKRHFDGAFYFKLQKNAYSPIFIYYVLGIINFWKENILIGIIGMFLYYYVCAGPRSRICVMYASYNSVTVSFFLFFSFLALLFSLEAEIISIARAALATYHYNIISFILLVLSTKQGKQTQTSSNWIAIIIKKNRRRKELYNAFT